MSTELDWSAWVEPEREALSRPFRIESGKCFATNGHVAIEFEGDFEKAEGRVPGGVAKAFDGFPTDGWKAADESPEKPRSCNSRWVGDEECDNCNGLGECDCHCGCEHVCGYCKGTGMMSAIVGGGDTAIEWSGGYIKRKYAWAAAQLPNVQVAVTDDSRIWLKFDGGRGLVMQVRREYSA